MAKQVMTEEELRAMVRELELIISSAQTLDEAQGALAILRADGLTNYATAKFELTNIVAAAPLSPNRDDALAWLRTAAPDEPLPACVLNAAFAAAGQTAPQPVR